MDQLAPPRDEVKVSTQSTFQPKSREQTDSGTATWGLSDFIISGVIKGVLSLTLLLVPRGLSSRSLPLPAGYDVIIPISWQQSWS